MSSSFSESNIALIHQISLPSQLNKWKRENWDSGRIPKTQKFNLCFSNYNFVALSFLRSLWAIIPLFEILGPDWQAGGSKTRCREHLPLFTPLSSKDPHIHSTFANVLDMWLDFSSTLINSVVPNTLALRGRFSVCLQTLTDSSKIETCEVQTIKELPCGGNPITGDWEPCHFPPDSLASYWPVGI